MPCRCHHRQSRGMCREHAYTVDDRLPQATVALVVKPDGGEVDVEHHVILLTLRQVQVQVVLFHELLRTWHMVADDIVFAQVVLLLVAVPCALPLHVGILPVFDTQSAQYRVWTLLLLHFADGYHNTRDGVFHHVTAISVTLLSLLQLLDALQDAVARLLVLAQRVVIEGIHQLRAKSCRQVGDILQRRCRVGQCLSQWRYHARHIVACAPLHVAGTQRFFVRSRNGVGRVRPVVEEPCHAVDRSSTPRTAPHVRRHILRYPIRRILVANSQRSDDAGLQGIVGDISATAQVTVQPLVLAERLRLVDEATVASASPFIFAHSFCVVFFLQDTMLPPENQGQTN